MIIISIQKDEIIHFTPTTKSDETFDNSQYKGHLELAKDNILWKKKAQP